MLLKNIHKTISAVILALTVVNAQQDSLSDTSYTDVYEYQTLEELNSDINRVFEDEEFSGAHWGVEIKSLNTGEILYERNSEKLFIPASNLKLFTTAAGLLALGPDYRYKTEVYINGRTDGSVLNGDLIIRGYGDPAISGRFYENVMDSVFKQWADSLKEAGISEIHGDIIGDDNVFDDQGLGAGWSWDYESYWFAASSSALCYNDNCVDLKIRPGKVGELAEIIIEPDIKYNAVINEVITVPADSGTSIDLKRERGTNILYVFGAIAADRNKVNEWATVHNPTQFFVVALKKVLEDNGIKVTGYGVDIDDMEEPFEDDDPELLFTHYSPPMTEIVKVINKNSQNLFAEQLLKLMGYEYYGLGSYENGLAVIDTMLQSAGLNTEEFVIADGSGLSRLNLVTPGHIVRLLEYMYNSDHFLDYYNSLPVAGVDGSLRKRMEKGQALDNVRAKTGYVGFVRSLSGYVYTGDRELLAFSMIANNFLVPRVLADRVQDVVCEKLSKFRRK